MPEEVRAEMFTTGDQLCEKCHRIIAAGDKLKDGVCSSCLTAEKDQAKAEEAERKRREAMEAARDQNLADLQAGKLTSTDEPHKKGSKD